MSLLENISDVIKLNNVHLCLHGGISGPAREVSHEYRKADRKV